MRNAAVPLDEIVKVVGGGTPSTNRPEYFRGHIPWVSPKDMKCWDIVDSIDHVTEEAIANSSTTLIARDAVLVVTRSGVLKHTLPVAINRVPVTLNQDMKALICSERVIPDYLARVLQALSSKLLQTVRGTTADNISTDVLRSLEIPLPTLPEQQRIADLLAQADRLRETRYYALELTGTLLPAAFLELFGETGDSFPALTVDELAADKPHAIRTGPFGSQLLHSEFTNRGIAVLGIDSAVNNEFAWSQRRFITPEKYEQLKRYTVFPGDVIITIMGTCGRCAIVPSDIPTAINTKHLCCITLDQTRCLPIYLHGAFLFHPFVRRQQTVATKGSIMDGLNMEIIKSLRIPLPPLELQQKFAAFVEWAERLRAVQREALRQAEHLFQTLLHRAFSDTDSTDRRNLNYMAHEAT